MLQGMMVNLKGLAKYLPKDPRAMGHNFPTIMLSPGPWHLSSQPVDFFFQYWPWKTSLQQSLPVHKYSQPLWSGQLKQCP